MIYVVKYEIIAVACSAIFVSSVIANDATLPHGDPGIKESVSQVSGLKTIRGRVTKSDEDFLTIVQMNGQKTVLRLESQTKFNTNLHPGDRITATVTNQGRAVEVQKESKPKTLKD